jgi:chorismate dehydratase
MPERRLQIAAVSFLNTKPLVHYLLDRPDVNVVFDVPSRLVERLHRGQADVGLIPVVDWARSMDDLRPVGDGCIASDGTTLTVRVFSRCRAEQVRTVHADVDSHTSVVLGQVLWRKCFGTQLRIDPLASLENTARAEAVLLIGDKVISQWREPWPCQIDLGELWKSLTGLPFVFAMWVARRPAATEHVARLLNEARDKGCNDARRLATIYGPQCHWPLPVAEEYLTRYMKYQMDGLSRKGLETFLEMAGALGLIPQPRATPKQPAAAQP